MLAGWGWAVDLDAAIERLHWPEMSGCGLGDVDLRPTRRSLALYGKAPCAS